MYLAVLLPAVPLDRLETALKQGVRIWKYFPRPAEILELAEVVPTSAEMQARCDRVSEELAERYKAAKREGRKPRLLRSINDAATPEELGRLPRYRQIALGIVEPKPVDVPARLRELQEQARKLGGT